MRNSMSFLSIIAGLLLVVSFANPAFSHCPTCSAGAKKDKGGDHAHDHAHTIVDTAVADGRFTILAKALTDTGLVEALQADGPLTVFAPTDEAFKKLPAGTLESLSKEDLVKILTSHVIAGKVKAKDAIAADGTAVASLQGFELPIAVVDGKVTVAGATVIAADVKASNGVIHVIDTVILPN